MHNQVPEHDMVAAEKPEDNTEVFTYYLGDKIVAVCKITYLDERHEDLESMEWNYGPEV